MTGFGDKVNEDKIRADIAARIALERPEKPVQTFSGGESYQGSADDVKRTSELLIGFKQVDTKTWIRKPEQIIGLYER